MIGIWVEKARNDGNAGRKTGQGHKKRPGKRVR